MKEERNRNPAGLRFPKYLGFEDGLVACTAMHTGDLKTFLQGKWDRVQRYITPEAFTVQKKAVIWRKTKRSKSYNVLSRVPCKAKLEGCSPMSSKTTSVASSPCPTGRPSKLSMNGYVDFTYIASLHNPKNCETTKEKRSCEEAETVAAVLRRAIETYAIAPFELVDQFVFSLLRSHDGKWVFLNCPRGKVTETAEDAMNKKHLRKTMSITELTSRIANKDKLRQIQQLILPMINLRDVAETTRTLYPRISELHLKLKPCPHARTQSELMVSNQLHQIAHKFDYIRERSQELKKAYTVKQVVKFADYPAGFLSRVIKGVYDAVMRDSRLSKYYYDKVKIRLKVEGAVRRVLVHGTTKMHMKEVHRYLGITNSDFNVYVAYFLAVLNAERVKPHEIAATKAYFEEFREDVVTASEEELEDDKDML